MSSDSDTPRELGRPGHSVVRLNRRVLGVVGGALLLAFVAGLVAIHEQGKRLTEPGAERRRAPAPRSQPWFQGIPDEAPTPRPVGMDTASPPASLQSPTGDEDEAQRRRRLLRAVMGAPIGVAALERSRSDHGTRRHAGQEAVVAAPAGLVVPADRAQTPSTPPSVTVSPPSSLTREGA
jgi:hypothetical protein